MNFAVAEELMTFDNIKNYDAVEQKVTIENTFGLGRTIADIKLDTPLMVYVPRGYQKVAQFTLNTYDTEYTNPLEKIDFYNKVDYTKEQDKAVTLERQFDYKLLTYEDVIVDDYVQECSDFIDAKNGSKTNLCYDTIKGSHTEQREKWVEFDTAKLTAGKYTIGIFTDVKKGDVVEWIPSFYGVKITEFAGFSESLKAGLVVYYPMNEIAGTILIDAKNNVNATTFNEVTPNVAGKLGLGKDFVRSGTNGFATLNSNMTSYAQMSVSSWVKTGTLILGNEANMFSTDTNNPREWGWSINSDGYERLYWGAYNLDNTTNISAISGWVHLVITIDDDANILRYYINGVNVKNMTLSGTIPYTATRVTIGASGYNNGSSSYDGLMDEVGWWNRTLSWSEVQDIYNGGAGLNFTEITTTINPYVQLNYPENFSNFSVSTIQFNYTGYVYSAGTTINQTELYIDGVSSEINSTDMANGTTYLISKSLGTGYHNWSVKLWDTNGTTNQSLYWYFNITIYPPNVTIHFPYSNSNYTTTNIHFNSTITDDFTLQNVTMYIDGLVNNTNTSGIEGLYQWDFILSEGNHNWSILAYDNDSNAVQTSTIPFSIDLTNPILSTSGIVSKYNSTLPQNVTWSLFNADPHADKCWYYTTDNSTNISVTCNTSTITNFTSHGYKTIYYFGNDTLGHQSTGSTTLFIGYYPYTQSTDKANVGSGDSVIFTLYVNGTDVSNQFSSTTATLNFNGTSYTPDTTDRTNQNYTKYTKTLYMTIGNTTGAITTYNWSYSIKNTTDIPLNVTTANSTIKIYLMAVRECVAGDRYILNASIKDEELKSLINASLNTTNIEIDLLISSRANTSAIWNFSKQWINNNTVYVCVSPNVLTYSSYKIDWTIGYSADDYVQEFYYMDNGTIDSTNYFNSYTTNPISLYDLASVDSTTFLFSFKDENNLEVDDAIVHVYRYYIGEGVFREVERAKQDNNGETHVHLVEEDVIYYFMITQYGNVIFTSSQYNAKCLSTPCSLTLSASPDFLDFPDDYDKVNGTTYTVTSSKTARTVTLTYSSNASRVVNFSVYKLLDGVDITYIDTASTTGTDGTLTLDIPAVQGNYTFFASIFTNGEWIKSEWVDMKEKAQDYFGTTGAILGGLLVLTLIFMAISEGIILIIIGIVAVILIWAMQLVDMSWLAVISIIIAGGLIIWKIRSGGNKQ
jgi:hypothetical protein